MDKTGAEQLQKRATLSFGMPALPVVPMTPLTSYTPTANAAMPRWARYRYAEVECACRMALVTLKSQADTRGHQNALFRSTAHADCIELAKTRCQLMYAGAIRARLSGGATE
jgi:hypothetical protein